MKKQLYSVYNQCSGLYEHLHFAQSDSVVIRDFIDLVTGSDNPFCKHPEHYTLMRLAVYDNTNGKVHDEVNESLITGLEAVARSRQMSEKQKMANGVDPYNNQVDIEELTSPGGTA